MQTTIQSRFSRSLVLTPHEVHVWFASLNVSAETFEELRGTLSAEEHARALRFRSATAGRYFIAARGILRDLLSRYIKQDPRDLKLCYTSKGKPFLRKGSQMPEINFNMAHSAGFALYAVSHSRQVGIDLERVESFAGRQHIANRFFSAGELAQFQAFHSTSQTQAFFRLWTRKEAYLKARGLGLTATTYGFDAPLKREKPVTFVDEKGLRWRAEELSPAPGYVGAVVAEGDDWRVQFLQAPRGGAQIFPESAARGTLFEPTLS
jgi:4'-phosphopantetheinyl transferase